MQKKNWVIAGIYLCALLIGWGSSFGISKWIGRESALPEEAQLNSMERQESDAVADKDTESRAKNSRTNKSSSAALSKAQPLNSYKQPILSRSIFDSSKVNAKPVAKEQSSDGSEALTDLELRLLATIVATPAEYSVALIQNNKSNQSNPYTVGDLLIDNATLHEIRQREVIIRRQDGTLERLTTAKEEGPKKKSTTKSKTDSSDDGVSKDGNKYIVDQEVFDELLKNPEKLYSQIRAVPHKDANGEIDGYRLSGIRRKSIFYKLGVKNGDIVHNVNGKSLNSMSSALDAFNSLQSSREFSFDLTRRRKQQTMEYEVR
jgi:general secretion pathway protein C